MGFLDLDFDVGDQVTRHLLKVGFIDTQSWLLPFYPELPHLEYDFRSKSFFNPCLPGPPRDLVSSTQTLDDVENILSSVKRIKDTEYLLFQTDYWNNGGCCYLFKDRPIIRHMYDKDAVFNGWSEFVSVADALSRLTVLGVHEI
jgi:hypothetical protein